MITLSVITLSVITLSVITLSVITLIGYLCNKNDYLKKTLNSKNDEIRRNPIVMQFKGLLNSTYF
jgi:hypothetical protein